MMDFIFEALAEAVIELPLALLPGRKPKPASQAEKNRRQRVRDWIGFVVLAIWFGGILIISLL
jgi:hypothetical protein